MFRFHGTNLLTAFPRSLGLILELRPFSCSHKVALVQDYRGGTLNGLQSLFFNLAYLLWLFEVFLTLRLDFRCIYLF